MTDGEWARLVIGRVAPGLPPRRGEVLVDVLVRDRGPWVEAVRDVLGVGIVQPGRVEDLRLIVVDARRGSALDRLEAGGTGLVVGPSDVVLGLGRRLTRAERGAWRQTFAPIAALAGAGGRVALWTVRGLRPPGGDPRLVLLRSRRVPGPDTL